MKYICCYCLQSFTTAQILGRHVNDCFDINEKQMIKMVKKSESVKFKNYTRKIKLSFKIHAGFESLKVF